MVTDSALAQRDELSSPDALIYPIGSQRLWGLCISIPIAFCLLMYLGLYYYLADPWSALLAMGALLAIATIRLGGLLVDKHPSVPAYGFVDADGIHYRRYVLMHLASWRAIERIEYWPQNNGQIDLYLYKNPGLFPGPVRFAPHPSWSQYTAEDLSSKPPAVIGYVRGRIHPSAFQFGTVSAGPGSQKTLPFRANVIDYFVAVGILLWALSFLFKWQTKPWQWVEIALLNLYLLIRVRWRT